MSEALGVVIIGTGPAGLAAAIYAGVYKLKFVVVGKDYGLLAGSHQIVNWPGIKSASGFEIVQKIREHAVEGFNSKIVDDEVSGVKKLEKTFLVSTKSSGNFEGKSLIIGTGLQNRKLGIGEERFVGKGVSYCATCDAFAFKDKTVAIIGGNDSAAQAALLLAEYAKKVYWYYRGTELRCQPIYLPKIQAEKKIELFFETNVVEVFGAQMLEKITIEKDGKKSVVQVDGLFPEIGAVPQSVLFQELQLSFDKSGFLNVDSNQKTSCNGVFAAGDITATHQGFKQAIVASAEGAVAANSAFKFLKESH